jgi:CheY-like chemotaxis protein
MSEPSDFASAPAAAADPVCGCRVLLVEDNDDARVLFAELLRLLGHEVEQAATGEVGVRMFAEWKPDFALVDIGLPDIDGYEVARRMRSSGHRATLVALTGRAQAADRADALAAGFDRHIAKPISRAGLAALFGSNSGEAS